MKTYSPSQFKKYLDGFIKAFNQDPDLDKIYVEDDNKNIFAFGPYDPDDDTDPQLIVFPDGTKLISVVADKQADIGQPDCVLTNPYVISDSGELIPWLGDYTKRTVFIVHSEKFLTVTRPTKTCIQKYKNLVDEIEE
jgi:hypothetical protein